MTDSEKSEVHAPPAAKKNVDLFRAFEKMAQQLGMPVRADFTGHEYDSLAVGNRPLKNALCIKSDSTSFFTADQGLRNALVAAGYQVESAPFRRPSPHNQYRFRVSDVSPAALQRHAELFEQVLRHSVDYIENPIAGNLAPKARHIPA